MRVMLAGRHGQLARELQDRVPAGVELRAFASGELDISDARAVEGAVAAFAPAAVINAAAYTAVDRAESEPERAMATNRDGAANLARAAGACGAVMIHLSTDFVFPGDTPRPLRPEDPVAPVSAYGRSKAAGEEEVMRILPERSLVIRTSWLYSSGGNNFVRTMLALAAKHDRISVVCDQVGSPTWAAGLAAAVWEALARGVRGVRHYADAGVASWYDLACAVMEEALALGLIGREPEVVPIPASEYPAPATRPAYSVLDSSRLRGEIGMPPVHWRKNLRRCLAELV